mgnify:CR=1 FL=1
MSSSTPFYGVNWFASNGLLYTAPGDYVMNTTTGAVTLAAPTTNVVDGLMHFQVGAGQVGGSIDFAWGASSGIRVVNVWNVNANGSLTAAAVPGMENGPFVGFNAEFNLSNPGLITPVPEASTYGMMLAGLGMVGFMASRRRKSV